MTYRLLTIAAVVAGLSATAQSTFPSLTGETADGKKISLPSDQSGGYTVIGLAYGRGAGPLLEEWYEPAYLRFIAKHGLFATSYECAVYFIPVFVGANKVAYGPSIKKFRDSAEPEIVDHVVFFNGEFDAARQQLGLDRDNIPYFFVLDGQGRIIHRTEGAFSDEKLDAIEEVMME